MSKTKGDPAAPGVPRGTLSVSALADAIDAIDIWRSPGQSDWAGGRSFWYGLAGLVGGWSFAGMVSTVVAPLSLAVGEGAILANVGPHVVASAVTARLGDDFRGGAFWGALAYTAFDYASTAYGYFGDVYDATIGAAGQLINPANYSIEFGLSPEFSAAAVDYFHATVAPPIGAETPTFLSPGQPYFLPW